VSLLAAVAAVQLDEATAAPEAVQFDEAAAVQLDEAAAVQLDEAAVQFDEAAAGPARRGGSGTRGAQTFVATRCKPLQPQHSSSGGLPTGRSLPCPHRWPQRVARTF
jgi:hypothetical protein